MTPYPFEANTRVALLDTVADVDAPTIAELDAGADVTCELTKDGLSVVKATLDADNTAWRSRQQRTRPAGVEITVDLTAFRALDGEIEALWPEAVFRTRKVLVVRRGVPYDEPWDEGDVVEVYEVVIGKRTVLASAANTATRFHVPLHVTGTDSTGGGAIVPEPPPAALASDTFTGGDDSDIDGRTTDSGLGGTARTWGTLALQGSVLGIASGVVVRTGTSNRIYLFDVPDGGGNVRVSAKVTEATNNLDIYCRHHASDRRAYGVEIFPSGGILRANILEWNSGGSTQMSSTPAYFFADGARVGIQALGNSLCLLIDDIPQYMVVDYTLDTSYTRVGMRAVGTPTVDLDDFLVEEASPPAIPASDLFTGGDDTDIAGRVTDSVYGGTPRTWSKTSPGGSERTLDISSGQLVLGAGSTAPAYGFDCGSGDVYLSIRLQGLGTTNGTVAFAVRQDSDLNTYTGYEFLLTYDSAQVGAERHARLRKVVNGTPTNFGAGVYYPIANGDRIGIRVNGTTVSLMHVNLAVETATDAAIPNTNTWIAIRPSSTIAGLILDDLVVSPV